MNTNRNKIFAWVLFALITASVIGGVILQMDNHLPGDSVVPFELSFALVPVSFAFMGALIISRQPRNVIGMLMMLPGLSFSILVDALLSPYINGTLPPPDPASFAFLVLVWFSNWNWLLLIFPILFIMILFPTGRPLSPRWRWLIYFGVFLCGLLIVLGAIAEGITPSGADLDWSLPNPIGFIPVEPATSYFMGFWFISLPVFVLLCVASVFIRFHRARGVEREQIKWLFYAGALFALLYVPPFFIFDSGEISTLFNLLLVVSLLIFPAAIAIAILRYRLYDIDVIIRRTVQYVILTGLLVLLYFGSVVLLQSVFESLTGERSPIVIVFSTLLIAALFNPLRIRLQGVIDRRLFRVKYDADQILSHFAVLARDIVDLDQLENTLMDTVEETMQPKGVILWLKRK